MKTSECPKTVAALVAQVMLHYMTPEGDAAWIELDKLIGKGNNESLALLIGWVIGRCGNHPSKQDWEELQNMGKPTT